MTDKQVAARFAITRQTVWRWSRTDPAFPRAVTLSAGCSRWRLSEIETWENSRSGSAA